MSMKKANASKAEAARRLLEPGDGELIGAFSTIEGQFDGLGAGITTGPLTFYAGMVTTIMRLFGMTPISSGLTIAITDTGIVAFKQNHKRIPVERLRRYDGHGDIGPRTRVDMLMFELDSSIFTLQSSQGAELGRVLSVLRTSA